MIHYYALKDLKIGYMSPVAFHTDGEALRSLQMAVRNAPNDSPLKSNPTDFEMWSIFEFDPISGKVEADLHFVGKCDPDEV